MTSDTPKSNKMNTLMLVDDNTFDQRMYKRIIDRSGLVENLLQFTDPQLALDYLNTPSNEMPSLVLLDINMPCIDGFQFLEIVTENLGESMCPVIVMLTTSLIPQDATRARQHSIVRDFLNKPLTKAMLEHLTSMIEEADSTQWMDRTG